MSLLNHTPNKCRFPIRKSNRMKPHDSGRMDREGGGVHDASVCSISNHCVFVYLSHLQLIMESHEPLREVASEHLWGLPEKRWAMHYARRHPTTGPQHTKLACALIITALSLERCMGLRSYLVGDSVSNIPLSSFLTDFFKHPITYNIYVQSAPWVIICDQSWGTALRKCWNLK